MLPAVDLASVRDKFIFPLAVYSRVSTSLCNFSKSSVHFRSVRQRNVCYASSSETLVANSRKDDEKQSSSGVVASKKEKEEFEDLKSWMHKNGLPPCKVILHERPSHNAKHMPIHYIAASEDLQAGDVAFSVPNSLVVTLERVLGNEVIVKRNY